MSELKQGEQEHEANALRINAGRKPKFGDMMRNPWASESNPQRDGYFVRERRQGGRFNPGHYYEFTDKCGKFWETNAKYAFFIDTQPEATKPAQDLQLVVATSTETGFFHVVIHVNDGKRTLVLYDKQHSLNGDTVGVADIPAAALASPADALVEGDRVDALIDALKLARVYVVKSRPALTLTTGEKISQYLSDLAMIDDALLPPKGTQNG